MISSLQLAAALQSLPEAEPVDWGAAHGYPMEGTVEFDVEDPKFVLLNSGDTRPVTTNWTKKIDSVTFSYTEYNRTKVTGLLRAVDSDRQEAPARTRVAHGRA